MKKLFKTIVTLSLLISGTLLFSQSAAAVWSPWQKEAFGHTARIFTDDTNYYSGAKTVDWRAEKKGSGTLYYTAGVYKKRSGGGLTDTNLVQRGYFKHSTPLKSFSVNEIRKRTGKGSYVIQIDCYTDAKKNNYVGTFESKTFYIK
ncbi:hypothetical protein SFC27_10030 [Bacillus licheniformis]|jgi:hypothetical protein|uniref:Uncharacterized protein n=2 Tax=Bacillus licheniformis TaxID=1402 RepID=Q65KQ6_BACLD|nr:MULTISPECIES: hypothetical protein [Bacillus]MBJ7887901.1 hypothetical protein [Bacillaceae bacterium HSR45]MBY8349919.1 hypothetical protein [Bacillus sp. PCH94]AAU23004.1 hypothetical protein BL05127 [Bacillus licheniformis DSM 13 = ATCC 14580]AAU40358.1 putative phage protein [Bacillus phage BLi_Pp3] [Bacillus licheniformis DSM 13 = ATCC 14580]AOP14602.1 hypothetical protein BL1202_01654 [Bacillus licheniformis]